MTWLPAWLYGPDALLWACVLTVVFMVGALGWIWLHHVEDEWSDAVEAEHERRARLRRLGRSR